MRMHVFYVAGHRLLVVIQVDPKERAHDLGNRGSTDLIGILWIHGLQFHANLKEVFTLRLKKKPTKEVKYSVVKLRRKRKSHTYIVIRM